MKSRIEEAHPTSGLRWADFMRSWNSTAGSSSFRSTLAQCTNEKERMGELHLWYRYFLFGEDCYGGRGSLERSPAVRISPQPAALGKLGSCDAPYGVWYVRPAVKCRCSMS
ncbi:hypothetical protein P3T22_006658 [Paraburkholderia sp. GAS348]